MRVLSVFLLLVLGVGVLLGAGLLTYRHMRNESGPELRQLPGIYATQTAISAGSPISTVDENIESGENVTVSVTPLPDYQATINALAVAQRNAEATVQAGMEHAANRATETAAAHLVRMNEAEYLREVNSVEHDQKMWLYHQQFQALLVTHQVERNAVDLERYQWQLEKESQVTVWTLAGWKILPLAAAYCFLLILFVRILSDEPEAPEPAQPVRLEVKNENRTRFYDLDLDEDTLVRWIRHAASDKENPSLAYGTWVTSGDFTRAEYDTLLDCARKENIIRFRNPDAPNQGQEVTPAGKAVLRDWLRTYAAHG